MNEQFWGEMLDCLKDIGSYLEKQDATQERAKISNPPKIAENPKPIKGGNMPSDYKPADRVAKEYVPMEEAQDRDAGELNAKGQTFLKEAELEEEIPAEEGEGEEEYSEDEEEAEGEGESVEQETAENELSEGGEEESMDELKSLLKDIRNALVKQSNATEVMKADLKKSLAPIVKSETDKMLRKMGLHPTRPEIQKLDVSKSYGIDTNEETKEVKKSADGKTPDMNKILGDMSKKSWSELGQLREKTDGFSPFAR
jgi:hypothetical protein